MLGWSAYENGESIQSMTIQLSDMFLKPGVFYVRAFVTNIIGKSIEFVSNPIKTKPLLFEYEGQAREINLSKGKYKLEVWGAQGGDSTGSRYDASKPGGKGGLGGYSSGILNLSKSTKIIVCVGGQGRSGNREDGSETDGGFPDGGGTKTGHYANSYTSVPGTGGGSTSIMISTKSLYSRVIVAGGGGGAGGDCQQADNGGFGGGFAGGNSYCAGTQRNQGAGTQTGSTPGPKGTGTQGKAGEFGCGAKGLYNEGCDSGGGGGGGWYGGGSGGYGGRMKCASGGGGSGWIFTESSFNEWNSNSNTESKHFLLDDSLYLADAATYPGNSSFPDTSGNGSETGHRGNGYAKITPL